MDARLQAAIDREEKDAAAVLAYFKEVLAELEAAKAANDTAGVDDAITKLNAKADAFEAVLPAAAPAEQTAQ